MVHESLVPEVWSTRSLQDAPPHRAEFWGPRMQGDSAGLSKFKGSKLCPQQSSLFEPGATPDIDRRQRGSESHQQPITAFLPLLPCTSQTHRLSETVLQRERERAGNSSSLLISEPETRCLQNAHIPRSKAKTVEFVVWGFSPIVCGISPVLLRAKHVRRTNYKIPILSCQ